MNNAYKFFCSICGFESKYKLVYCLSDRRMGLTGEWSVVCCESCGVMSMNPMPTDAQLTEYYSEYAGNTPLDFSLKAGSRWPRLRKFFHRLSGDIDPRDFIVVSKGDRILDYGCGNVGYLADFRDRGFDIAGAELSARVVGECKQKGLDVRLVESFSNIPFGNSEFDTVYLMQVFEHLRDPNLFLNELSRILKSGGMLYLAVPNVKSIWRGIFGLNWVSGWFAPFHLFHYTSESLGSLARKHGFKVIESWSNTPESWFRLNLKSTLLPSENRLDTSKHWLDNRFIKYLLIIILRTIELTVKERDCLVVKLQKI